MVRRVFRSVLETLNLTESPLQAVFYPDTLIDDGLNLFAAKRTPSGLPLSSIHLTSPLPKYTPIPSLLCTYLCLIAHRIQDLVLNSPLQPELPPFPLQLRQGRLRGDPVQDQRDPPLGPREQRVRQAVRSRCELEC